MATNKDTRRAWNFQDLTGRTFGRLTVVSAAPMRGHVTYWKCLCSCGAAHEARAGDLKNGSITSCGCRKREGISKRTELKPTHGLARAAEYNIWNQMLTRCYNSNFIGFHLYGGRGIKVCERWHSFENFYADMGPRLSPKHSLDRFPDQNGDYEPVNVRWATKKEQGRNRRDNITITYRGETKTLAEWAEEKGLPYHTARRRFKLKWSAEKIIETPLQMHKSHSRRILP